MCTSIVLKERSVYFGRNLDLEYSFGERVVVTPRNYGFKFRAHREELKSHYAMIGMATAAGGYPLYAEAVNEKGLYMAGLNFPGNAYYKDMEPDRDNITPFELIPWILGKAADISEARKLIERLNIFNQAFSEKMPLAPLHWHISDGESTLVMEQTGEGLKLFDDPIGVLTNNPTFDFHLMNLNRYMNLSPEQAENRFSKTASLKTFGEGMGAIGLPGDSSPSSRYIKTAFLKLNSVQGEGEEGCVSQFFHILDSVAMVRGSVITEAGNNDITTYSCCINGDKGIYYYKTYENNRISAVDMFKEDLEASEIKEFPLSEKQDIYFAN